MQRNENQLIEGARVPQTSPRSGAAGQPASSGALRKTPPGRAFALSFLVIGVLSTLWAFASPLMSVPDEPAHTIKAASVARGELFGIPGANQGEAATVSVPAYIAAMDGYECFAFRAEVSAACAVPVGDDTTMVSATTTAGNYNPLYYFVAGLPTLFAAGEPALYSMRVLSGILCSVFLATTFAAAVKFRSPRWPFTAAAVGITPMVLFLCGAVNPNALEISSAASFFLNLCVVLESRGELPGIRFNVVMVGIAGAVLANTRPLSLLWIALATAAALAVYGFRPLLQVLRNWLGLLMAFLIGSACVAALWWFLVADSLRSLTGKPSGITEGDAFLTMVEKSLDYGTGYIGRMGWLDTTLPNSIYVLWYVLMGALVIAGLAVRPLRARLAVAMLLIALLLVPAFLQAQVIVELGWIWQGRYVLALVLVILLCCGVVLRKEKLPGSQQSRAIVRLLIVFTVAAHLYAFVFTLRRYVTGLTGVPEWDVMLLEPGWQPPMSWQGLAALYLLTLVAAGTAVYRFLFGVPERKTKVLS